MIFFYAHDQAKKMSFSFHVVYACVRKRCMLKTPNKSFHFPFIVISIRLLENIYYCERSLLAHSTPTIRPIHLFMQTPETHLCYSRTSKPFSLIHITFARAYRMCHGFSARHASCYDILVVYTRIHTPTIARYLSKAEEKKRGRIWVAFTEKNRNGTQKKWHRWWQRQHKLSTTFFSSRWARTRTYMQSLPHGGMHYPKCRT